MRKARGCRSVFRNTDSTLEKPVAKLGSSAQASQRNGSIYDAFELGLERPKPTTPLTSAVTIGGGLPPQAGFVPLRSLHVHATRQPRCSIRSLSTRGDVVCFPDSSRADSPARVPWRSALPDALIGSVCGGRGVPVSASDLVIKRELLAPAQEICFAPLQRYGSTRPGHVPSPAQPPTVAESFALPEMSIFHEAAPPTKAQPRFRRVLNGTAIGFRTEGG